MSKMHYLTNFQKSSSVGPAPLNLWFWWFEVAWFGQIVVLLLLLLLSKFIIIIKSLK